MYNILIIEDSPMVLKVLKHVISGISLFIPHYATSFAEAKALVEGSEHGFFAALVDLNLPDATNGEVVDYTLELGLPTVVLTASFDEAKRSELLAKGIVDYVTKESRYSYEYAFGVLERLIKNQQIKVLVVDDSDMARRFICTLLRIHLYQVVEAADGMQAIKQLLETPDIKLLISDYNMPRMDGCELVKNIRAKYEKSDLVIIGLSSDNEQSLSARFIKAGANDFLRKPFNHEEFYCRVNQNVEVLELINSIRDNARRDHLSGAFNAHYFKSIASERLTEAVTSHKVISLALLEVDGFDAFVNEWGLEISELALKQVVEELMGLFDRFIMARAEKQRFFVLLPGLSNEKALAYVEKVRQIFCTRTIEFGGGSIQFTYTAGVTSIPTGSIEEFIDNAEFCLNRAHEAGGDLVFGDD